MKKILKKLSQKIKKKVKMGTNRAVDIRQDDEVKNKVQRSGFSHSKPNKEMNKPKMINNHKKVVLLNSLIH